MTYFNLNQIRAYFNYRKWLKTYQIKTHIQNIEHYFADINGYILSKAARIDAPNLSLTYGEIDLESFLALLSLAKPKPQHVFYDLGCGLGKTVIACAQVYQVKKAYGIEYLPELITHAQSYAIHHPQIEFKVEHILDTDWSDADILFLNVATFIPETWEAINQKIIKHPVPTVITCGKALSTTKAYHIRATKVKTSWDIINAYIHTLDEYAVSHQKNA